MIGHFGTCVLVLALFPQLSTALSLSTVSSHSASDLPLLSGEKQLARKLQLLKQDEMDAKEARREAELAVSRAWEAETKYQKDIGGPLPPVSEKFLYINRTAVRMPSNWADDYTWGHSELYLYPEGHTPGHRNTFDNFQLHFDESTGATWKTANVSQHWDIMQPSPEKPNPKSWLTQMGCAPKGVLGAVHKMYGVGNATLVPFVLDKDKHPARTDAAIVVVPGGGGEMLAWDTEGISVASWLNRIGINAFVLKYRVPVSNSVDYMDLQRAISLIRHNAGKYGINPSRIGAIGFSHGAGVILNGIYGSLKSRAYSRIDDVDDVDYTPNFLMLLYPGTNQRALTDPSYAKKQLRSLPPTFWATSLADKCVGPMNAPYIKAMQKDPASHVTMRIYEQGGHAFASCELFPSYRGLDVCEWKNAAAQFLNTTVLERLQSE